MLGAAVPGMVRSGDRRPDCGGHRVRAGQTTQVSCDMIQAYLCCFVTVHVAAGDELRPLFRAIRALETSGMAAPHRAVGDKGRSIGPYQITRAYWMDSGSDGKWTWCRGHAYSEAVML